MNWFYRIASFLVIKPPGMVVLHALMFYPWFFLSPRNLRAALANRRETLPRDRKLAEFYNTNPKFRSSLKLGGQKHAKFRSILYHYRIWSRISPERVKVSKIESKVIENDSSCVQWKKSGERWSTNYRVFDVSLDPLKQTFSGDYTSAIRGWGAARSNFYTR